MKPYLHHGISMEISRAMTLSHMRQRTLGLGL
jgi:hypothetical protein